MPRIFKQLRTVGVYMSFEHAICQLQPGPRCPTAHPVAFCIPGVPYEVLLEYIEPESTDEDGTENSESLWLGLRQQHSTQAELDWVCASDSSGKISGIYFRLNQQADYSEET